MTSTITAETDAADTHIRLDFVWETTALSPRETSTGRYNGVSQTMSNGSLSHLLSNVTVEHDSNTVTASVTTTKTQVVENEVTAFEDELRQAMMTTRNGTDPGEASEIHVSAVHMRTAVTDNTVTQGIATHPALHYAIRASGAPNTLTAATLETAIRQHQNIEGKRVDVTETMSGFNVHVRESTITRSEARTIRTIIMEKENVKRPETHLVYTSLTSGELPEPTTNTTEKTTSD